MERMDWVEGEAEQSTVTVSVVMIVLVMGEV